MYKPEYPIWYYLFAIVLCGLYVGFLVWVFKTRQKKKKEKEEQKRKAQEAAVAAIDREYERKICEEERRKQAEIDRARGELNYCKMRIRNTISSNPIYTNVIPQEAKKWAQKLIDLKNKQVTVSETMCVEAWDSAIRIGGTRYEYNNYGLQNLPDHRNNGLPYYEAMRDLVRDKFIEEVRNEYNRHGVSCKITYRDGDNGVSGYVNISCQIGELRSW